MKKGIRYNLILSILLVLTMLFTGVIISKTKNASASTTEGKGTIDVYLIGGQSNAVGYGKDTNGTLANADARFSNGFDNVLYYGEQERYSGVDVSSDFLPVKIGYGNNANTAGAEIGIASAVAGNGKTSAIIKCAWGATNIYPDIGYDISRVQGTWTPDSYLQANQINPSTNELIGRMYKWFKQTVTTGLSKLKAQGYTPVIKGMWWMQGEAEMGMKEMALEYAELLKALIKDVRADVSQISGQDCSEMPFVFGLPFWNIKAKNPDGSLTYWDIPAFQDDVREQMATVANDTSVINVASVDCAAGPNNEGLVQHDMWHFDAASQKWLGEQFISTLQTLNEGKAEKFNETISIADKGIRYESPNGIRYFANIADYNQANGYKYGMLILPYDYLIDNNINGDYVKQLADNNIDVIDLKCNVLTGDINGDGYTENYIQGSITDIKYSNLNRKFVGIAYIKDSEGNYSYSAGNVISSVSNLAGQEIYEYEQDDTEFRVIKNYISSSINQQNGVDEAQGNEVANLSLTVDEAVTFYNGNYQPYKLQVIQEPALDLIVKYSSNNDGVATVDENGVITPVAVGEAVITVSCAGVEKTVNVSVINNNYTANGITIDGQISSQEQSVYGTYELNCDATAGGGSITNVKGTVINKDIYLGITITHGEWSQIYPNWYDNDNFQISLSGDKNYIAKFIEGKLELSSNIYCGVASTTQSGDNQITVLELCIKGDRDAYKFYINANGKGFGWNGILWYGDGNIYGSTYGILSSTGIETQPVPGTTIEGVCLDGNLNDSIYSEIKAITTTANNAQISIKGKKMNDGILVAYTIAHSKAPDEPTASPYDWFTYTNIEIRVNGVAYFITSRNEFTKPFETFGYSSTVRLGTNSYETTCEMFIYYEDLMIYSDNELNVEFGGWFNSGWSFLFGGGEGKTTHVMTENGLAVKQA